MIVNKKFDRLKQWGRERMGGEVKTDTSDEFKGLMSEMQLRHEGMDRLNRSAKDYMKNMSRRDAGEGKEKQTSIGYFASTMSAHGDDFEPDSEFGQCLSSLGRANERIARIQETYAVNASGTWLESIERSLVQMKEYQDARKKLENRRLAYDTASMKMQKSKREDFRAEEELRSQKAKYEESSEDVYRRMLDIKEAEVDSVVDLGSFLEAELSYYDRCRDVLLQLKRDWPAQIPPSNGQQTSRSDAASPVNGISSRRGTNTNRSRASSTVQRFGDIAEDEPLEPPSRSIISSRLPSGQNSPRRELPGFDLPVRPTSSRSNSMYSGYDGQQRAESPGITGMPRLSRAPTSDASMIMAGRSQLRITKRDSGGGGERGDVFGDEQQGDYAQADHGFEPLQHARTASWSTSRRTGEEEGGGGDGGAGGRRMAPPPPPPSRSKKPPPPLPMKRSALSTSEVPHY